MALPRLMPLLGQVLAAAGVPRLGSCPHELFLYYRKFSAGSLVTYNTNRSVTGSKKHHTFTIIKFFRRRRCSFNPLQLRPRLVSRPTGITILIQCYPQNHKNTIGFFGWQLNKEKKLSCYPPALVRVPTNHATINFFSYVAAAGVPSILFNPLQLSIAANKIFAICKP